MKETVHLSLSGEWRYDRAGAWSGPLLAIGCALLGIAIAGSAARPDASGHFWHSYLLHLCFFISIAVGGLFFVILQHLTRAAWSVVVRRIAELMTATLPVLAVLFLPIVALLLAGGTQLYEWNNAELVQSDALLQSKEAYLNPPFFALRCAVYLFVWCGLARYFRRQSRRQDASHDPRVTLKLQKWSGPAMMAFAVTVTFASFDWLMSLDPHWFSAVYGVYFFAGSTAAVFAALIVICDWLGRRGILTTIITTEHFHDLGKLLFGFNFFWAYIAFSQYLLIWYANIPEETTWYLVRQSPSWGGVSLVLLVGHFILPFFGLMSRHSKRNRKVLVFWAWFTLAMHWLDLYWLVMPSHAPLGPVFGLSDVVCLAGFAAIFFGTLLRAGARCALLPIGDPRLAESLALKST